MKKRLFASFVLLVVTALAQSTTTSVHALAEITVATAGTPVAVSSSALLVSSWMVQADPANTGTLFVEDSGHNVICKITAGSSCTPPQGRGDVDLSTFFLDGSTNGQKGFVSYAKN